MGRAPHVFLSYVQQDLGLVQSLKSSLEEAGVNVWFDRQSLTAGVSWRDAIRDAIPAGLHFLACFSSNLEARPESFMHEEIDLAVGELALRPSERNWFIPLRVDACEVPAREIGGGRTLRDLHHLDLFPDFHAAVYRLIGQLRQNVETESSLRMRARDLAVGGDVNVQNDPSTGGGSTVVDLGTVIVRGDFNIGNRGVKRKE